GELSTTQFNVNSNQQVNIYGKSNFQPIIDTYYNKVMSDIDNELNPIIVFLLKFFNQSPNVIRLTKERIKKYLQFEKYLLDELIPFISQENENPHLISAGCSLGAYHAVNIAFRHPLLFKKAIGISGRYDLTIHLQFYNDLFDGYRNEDIYFNMPSQYIPNLTDEAFIHSLQNLEIIFIVGNEDAFLENNILLSDHLKKKNIPNILHLMEGEAHKPKYWGELLKLYL
ncbi:MAG: alpha/beta hydrolase-fold protein, partial [Ferruginibacter sp.]